MVDHPQKPGLQLQTLVDAAAAPPPFLENSYCSKCKKDTDHEATCRFVVWPEQRFLAVYLKRTPRDFANAEVPACPFNPSIPPAYVLSKKRERHIEKASLSCS